MSAFLVAKRMEAQGYPMTTVGANQGVDDVFVLASDHPQGRSNPFVDLASGYRWGQVAQSGRKTVWNTGTRGGAQTVLFAGDHFRNGLRPDADDVMLANLDATEPLPERDALCAFLTRAHDWPNDPSREALHDQAAAFLGMSREELHKITEDAPLDVPLLGDPEWSADLLVQSDLGPPEEDVEHGAALVEATISVESIRELPDSFKQFLAHYGVTTSGPEELHDLLAATLSSQFVMFAGPSGSGKSMMASALSAFFAPKDLRARLEASRLLARPQEFFGYYSHLAGERFEAYDQLITLLLLDVEEADSPPMVTIEEGNLSPLEGYFSPLVHGFGATEAETLAIPLHSQPGEVASQVPDLSVPRTLMLPSYPRIFVTLNVDSDSPAPARKVVSRSCVVLLETPTIDTAMAAVDTLAHPPINEGDGPAAAHIGRPTIAFDRYVATGSETYQQALAERLEMIRGAIGIDVAAHRQIQRSLMYMAWYVELVGDSDAEVGDASVEAAADNALLHFILPSLPADHFEKAIKALNDGNRTGVLPRRLERLEAVLGEQQFGPTPDFWGALS